MPPARRVNLTQRSQVAARETPGQAYDSRPQPAMHVGDLASN